MTTFMAGSLYFRGRELPPKNYSMTWKGVLEQVANTVVAQLYDQFFTESVSDKELEQLLAPTLSGISQKFMSQGLGLIESNSGSYEATCTG
ncbi:MAG: hypothetical protein AAGG51_27595 [Cyanobacteria bacterium P01_G01_bin.54]